MRRLSAAVLTVILAVLAACAPYAASVPAPTLVVIIVVDQMRADYVERFKADWTGGLKRLVTQGAWFRQAAYPYLTTVTCAGHATVATGALPHRHGVFQNGWWNRDTSSQVTCTGDATVKNVGYDKPDSGGDSASMLWTPTLGDEMRAQKGAHVAALSLKDRSAIMLAGHGGDSVVWLNNALDGWETSSAFAAAPVPAAKAFLAANSIDADYGRTWARMLPDARYRHPDAGLDENPPRGWTSTFPHVLTSASGQPDSSYHTLWERSPFADAFLGRFAAALVDGLGLGKHDATDLLAVSFSTPDLVGHAFGPRSQEIQDVYAHLDRTIGALLDHLDATVGKGRYVVALTADHGVVPIPEQQVREGRDAGRLNTRTIGDVAEKAAAAALGEGTYVARESGNDLYFAAGVYERLSAKPGALDAVVAALAAQPGVQRVFRSEQLLDAATASDPLQRAAALSYVAGRSGDIVLAPKTGWMFAAAGTTHGTASADDQHVPILLLGPGIRHGQYQRPASPADIAPTLAALAGVLMPHAEGRVLREALSK
jgi:predicted AlkP superfamily pyrophosphatase or phosphodiesterase